MLSRISAINMHPKYMVTVTSMFRNPEDCTQGGFSFYNLKNGLIQDFIQDYMCVYVYMCMCSYIYEHKQQC